MYKLSFMLSGLPKTTNSMGRKHWAIKAKEAKYWKSQVAMITLGKRPIRPLERAQLTYVRFSSVAPDYDGLVSSFKHIQDALVTAKVLLNDTLRVVATPIYMWAPAKKGCGHIAVTVEEIPSDAQ